MNIDPHERRCLELAWKSCAAGTIGVGAVLVSADGQVLAEGANGLFAPSPTGPLSGSPIAHAEMNVLAQLSAGQNHETATLYTSLEPCVMCAGALIITNVAEIRVLAADPLMSDLEPIGGKNPWVQDRWAPRVFTDDVTARELSSLFTTHSFLFWFGDDHPVVDAWRNYDLDLLERMKRVVADRTLLALAEQSVDLDAVIDELGEW